MDELNIMNEENQNENINFMWHQVFNKMVKDMKFIGIYYIVVGGLSCLSIIGAIVGIPYIFMGLRLKEAAEEFDLFKRTNNSLALRKGFELQGKHFFIYKIIIIVSLILLVIWVIFIIAMLGTIMSNFGGYNSFPQS